MTFRGKIILYGSILLLFLTGLILALVLRMNKQEIANTPENVVKTNQNEGQKVTIPEAPPAKIVTKEEVNAANKEILIQTRVKNFVEIFGSYSVEANFQNFVDIRSMVTDQVAAWLSVYPDQLKKQQAVDFIGVTTRVLGQKIQTLTDSAATVLVSTQREETKTSGKSITYKDMLVDLKLSGTEWLIAGARWQ